MKKWIVLCALVSGCAATTEAMCVAPEPGTETRDRACSSVFNAADTQRIRLACPEATLIGLECPIPEASETIAGEAVSACSELLLAARSCTELRDQVRFCFCPELP